MKRKYYLYLLLVLPGLCRAQSGSEIYVFDFAIKNGVPVLSNPVNVSNHKGYDNQPSFSKYYPTLYFSSIDASGRNDIKRFSLKGFRPATYATDSALWKRDELLTKTTEREYSPTVTPDHKFVSCIIQRDNGNQDLGKYPLGGGKAKVLVDNLKVGYHAWINRRKVLLFVLGSGDQNTLQEYHLGKKRANVITSGIGRSLHRIPGRKTMSFVSKPQDGTWMIREYDPRNGKVNDLAPCLPGKEDLAWAKNDLILMSDGEMIFWLKAGGKTGWQPVSCGKYPFMKGITRLAIDPSNRFLALVAAE